MLKGFKYRIYPTKKQKCLIDKHINACRLVYNLALECKQMAWIGNKVNLSCFDLHSQLKTLKMNTNGLKK
jgi:putative transposase